MDTSLGPKAQLPLAAVALAAIVSAYAHFCHTRKQKKAYPNTVAASRKEEVEDGKEGDEEEKERPAPATPNPQKEEVDEEKEGDKKLYDVFLSFRGKDTRHCFADFLYHSLVDAGVRVFRDEDELPLGERIGPQLLYAIENSKISIPIISVDYASSKWCLRELVEITYFYKNYGTPIFPIFYKVNPCDLWNESGDFAKAFSKAVDELKAPEDNDIEKTAGLWRNSLKRVALIKGWESEKVANGQEGLLVDVIVAKVLAKLNRKSRYPPLRGSYTAKLLRVDDHHHTEREYDVFLNFCDLDTGTSFSNYLYHSLVRNGIRVFSLDDPRLIGKQRNSEVANAIKNCKISIAIISENYASSKKCLCELERMLAHKEKNGLKVWPIYYKVKSEDLKAFQAAMDLKWKKPNLVEQWKQALQDVGSLNRLDLKNFNGYEGKLVRDIVKRVPKELKGGRKQNPQQPPEPNQPEDFFVDLWEECHCDDVKGMSNCK